MTTTTFVIGYLFADGGRQASGRKGTAGDCVTRAAALLQGFRDGLSMTDFGSSDWAALYDATYRRMATANRDGRGGTRSARNGLYKQDYEPVFLNDFGFVKVSLGRGTRPTYSEAYDRFGPCIVKTRKHVCALIDGKLLDIFDGRFYDWEDEYGDIETRQRKAMSVYALPGWDDNPDGSKTLPTGAKYTRLTEDEYYRRYGGMTDDKDRSATDLSEVRVFKPSTARADEERCELCGKQRHHHRREYRTNRVICRDDNDERDGSDRPTRPQQERKETMTTTTSPRKAWTAFLRPLTGGTACVVVRKVGGPAPIGGMPPVPDRDFRLVAGSRPAGEAFDRTVAEGLVNRFNEGGLINAFVRMNRDKWITRNGDMTLERIKS